MQESIEVFEERKKQHIEFALSDKAKPSEAAGFDKIQLMHEALPEVNWDEIDISTEIFGEKLFSPFFVSSMTAGHESANSINHNIAGACERAGVFMAVGSQRRQLFDRSADREWLDLRERYPGVKLLGNIGLSQLVELETQQVDLLVKSLGAVAMIVHTNPLQEALQVEGTPQFSRGLEALKRLAAELEVPVVLKETGCGFSAVTLSKLVGSGLSAVDVSGSGGTHWGRVEGLRAEPESLQAVAAETFGDWGISTVESLLAAKTIKKDFKIWSSGGIRNGLDIAKSLALGAEAVGMAGPIMKRALISQESVFEFIQQIHFELRVALFCTGSRDLSNFVERCQWHLRT